MDSRSYPKVVLDKLQFPLGQSLPFEVPKSKIYDPIILGLGQVQIMSPNVEKKESCISTI